MKNTSLLKATRVSAVVLLLIASYPAFSLPTNTNAQVKTFNFYAQFYQRAQSGLEQVFHLNPSENSERIRRISALFIDVPYVPNRLIGSSDTPEQLVIDFGALDCFTYLDYVEALRKSDTLSDFPKKLIETRYIDNKVDYLSRRHFFSDWVSEQTPNAQDMTETLTNDTESKHKILNRAEDGSVFIIGLTPKHREITYIPGDKIDANVINNLESGDYIGIYTDIKGLDVTHTGLFIQTKQGPMFRNSSSISSNMKVVDSPFLEYVKDTPGIVVYRAI